MIDMTNNEFIAQVLAEFNTELPDIWFVSETGKTSVPPIVVDRFKIFLTRALTASAQNAIESVRPGLAYKKEERGLWNVADAYILEVSKRYFV